MKDVIYWIMIIGLLLLLVMSIQKGGLWREKYEEMGKESKHWQEEVKRFQEGECIIWKLNN